MTSTVLVTIEGEAMAGGEFKIDESTFSEMSVGKQLWLLFSEFNSHRAGCESRFCDIDKRCKDIEDTLKNRTRINTVASAGGGVFGGFMAMMLERFTK